MKTYTVDRQTIKIYQNESDSTKILWMKECHFEHSRILIFDGEGVLTAIGGELYCETNGVYGSSQLSAQIPAKGFLVEWPDSDDGKLSECHRDILGDAVLYNSTMAPGCFAHGTLSENTLTVSVEEPEVPTKDTPRFLFIGNSFTYFKGVPLKFRNLCKAAGAPVSIRYCTFGATRLKQFADETQESGAYLRSLLNSETYDYAVLQDATNVTEKESMSALKVLLPLLEQYHIKPFLYMRPKPDNIQRMKEGYDPYQVYHHLETELMIPAAPAAVAFDICREKYPELILHADDHNHVSDLGSYLIACTWLATYLHKSPVHNSYHAFLPQDAAEKLQECAWEAAEKRLQDKDSRLSDYLAWKQPGSLGETRAISQKAAEEGIVLLKNDDTLPLKQGQKVALFGRLQTYYIKSGTGSGGKVNAPYVITIREGLEEAGVSLDGELQSEYDQWIESNPIDQGNGWFCPWNQEEMPLMEDQVIRSAEQDDVALVIVGRTAGEDRDCTDRPGSFFLSETEEQNLKLITKHFKKVCVLLNIGSIIDMSWTESIPVSAILCLWQGGMEGGRACASVLTGAVTPSGKLADTIAGKLEDYPSWSHFGNRDENIYEEDIYTGYRYFETFRKDAVLYPFGFGLSYTKFSVSCTAKELDDHFAVTANVKNIGAYNGKEVVQIYLEAPSDGIGNPSRRLVAFAKTSLLVPGEETSVTIHIPKEDCAFYDDFRHCWILEKGTYSLYCGTDVRNSQKVLETIWQETIVKQCKPLFQPEKPFERLTRHGKEFTPASANPIPLVRKKHLEFCGDQGIRLPDVAAGKFSMEEFLSQIPDEQLIYLVRGEGMNSPKVTGGSAGAFGGVTEVLLSFGIPLMCATDGPSGVRLSTGAEATALPNGTLLACTWNVPLMEELFYYEGAENRLYRVDTLLGPGINLHRHPLCGRNFEYFSECPVLTGKIASGVLRGMEKAGACGTIKHFFGNNQETNRYGCNAVMSERAARELYVKAFQIAVEEGHCRSIMTSYNPVNGVWSASNKDLTATLLREEWGFRGIVMTDWWARVNSDGPEHYDQTSLHRMVQAQNDLYMPTPDATTRNDDLFSSLKEGVMTRDDLLECAEHICEFAMETPAFIRAMVGNLYGNVTGDQIQKAMEVFSLPSLREEEDTEFEISSGGDYILELRVRALGDDLAQSSLTVRIDGAPAASITCGVLEGERLIYRAVTMIAGKRKFRLCYLPSELEILSVRLLK